MQRETRVLLTGLCYLQIISPSLLRTIPAYAICPHSLTLCAHILIIPVRSRPSLQLLSFSFKLSSAFIWIILLCIDITWPTSQVLEILTTRSITFSPRQTALAMASATVMPLTVSGATVQPPKSGIPICYGPFLVLRFFSACIVIYWGKTNYPQTSQLRTIKLYSFTQFLRVRIPGKAQLGGSGSRSLGRLWPRCPA